MGTDGLEVGGDHLRQVRTTSCICNIYVYLWSLIHHAVTITCKNMLGWFLVFGKFGTCFVAYHLRYRWDIDELISSQTDETCCIYQRRYRGNIDDLIPSETDETYSMQCNI